jgi:hypothetical protein
MPIQSIVKLKQKDELHRKKLKHEDEEEQLDDGKNKNLARFFGFQQRKR